MVYCTKCGKKNEDDAVNCVECNEPLGSYRAVRRGRRRKDDECFGRKDDECFGLPHGGAIVGLVIGLIIILWGVSEVLNLDLGDHWWAFIIVLFGTLMVAGAIYSLNRKR